ncbi:MAG: segregation/condensation protein A [Clostridia bacterium]
MSIFNETLSKYSLNINNFEGPLDLLCYLIDKKKMNIFDVSLSEITDAYIEYLDAMEKMNMEIASEFLVMASNLLYIKSKSLLPDINSSEEDEEESEEDILKRIAEYKKYKFAASLMEEMYKNNYGCVVKSTEAIKLPQKQATNDFSAIELNEAYLEVLKRNKQKVNIKSNEIEDIIIIEKVTVRSKVKQMLNELFHKTSFVFNKLFNIEENNQVEIVTAFLGMLELAKLKKIDVSQKDLFGDITVRKINDEELDLELIQE